MAVVCVSSRGRLLLLGQGLAWLGHGLMERKSRLKLRIVHRWNEAHRCGSVSRRNVVGERATGVEAHGHGYAGGGRFVGQHHIGEAALQVSLGSRDLIEGLKSLVEVLRYYIGEGEAGDMVVRIDHHGGVVRGEGRLQVRRHSIPRVLGVIISSSGRIFEVEAVHRVGHDTTRRRKQASACVGAQNAKPRQVPELRERGTSGLKSSNHR